MSQFRSPLSFFLRHLSREGKERIKEKVEDDELGGRKEIRRERVLLGKLCKTLVIALIMMKTEEKYINKK